MTRSQIVASLPATLPDDPAPVDDVVLNQVLVRVGDAETTDRLIERIQQGGTAWIGATTWRGERLLRISVSNWSTTADDVDRSIEAIKTARSEAPSSTS